MLHDSLHYINPLLTISSLSVCAAHEWVTGTLILWPKGHVKVTR